MPPGKPKPMTCAAHKAWREHLTRIYPFRPGQVLICRDAADGANFLHAGGFYRVESVQADAVLGYRVILVGMARAWEPGRFEFPD
jgi:hypothetical protein